MAQQQSKPDQGLIGSILNDVGIIEKQTVGIILTGASQTIPFLKEVIGGAFNGGSKGLKDGNLINGLFGTIAGLLDSVSTGFRKSTSKAIAKSFEGELNRIE